MLVTGGSSGIGQAIAVRFAEYGANVAINYLRQPEEAAETEEQVQACVGKVQREGVKDVLVQGDVSNEDDVVRMVAEAVEGLGGIDILVNNAGIQISRPTEELSSADFDRVLAVNLRGSFLCAREAIRHFLAEDKPGSIVNISSVHQLIPKPGYLGYSASKGGMQNLTRTLALEYAGPRHPRERRRPGATVTPINRAWIDDPEKRRQVEEHIPMRRAGDSDEMAGVTAFLASDDAAYITGQTIFVDGGLTLFPSFLTPGRRNDRPRLGMLEHVDEAKRREALWRSSARGASSTSAACSTRKPRCSRGATSARRWSRRPTTRTQRRRRRRACQLDHGAGGRHDAARHAPRRAEPPPDVATAATTAGPSPSSPARPASSGSASRPSRRS